MTRNPGVTVAEGVGVKDAAPAAALHGRRARARTCVRTGLTDIAYGGDCVGHDEATRVGGLRTAGQTDTKNYGSDRAVVVVLRSWGSRSKVCFLYAHTMLY